MQLVKYTCNNCSTEFEVFVKIEEETTCPVCDGTDHTKAIISVTEEPQRHKLSSICGSDLCSGNCSSGTCG